MQKHNSHLEALLALLKNEGHSSSEQDAALLEAMLKELPEEHIEFLHELYLDQGMKALQKTFNK